MKTVNKKLLAVAVAGVLGMGSVSAMAEDGVSANVGFTSNYTWRGVSQSANDPAVQGGFDFTKGNTSLGVWGSSIGFGLGPEIDAYGSYSLGPVSIGAIYYYYPTAGGDFYELNISGDAGPVSLMASYSPDAGGGVSTTYYEASYSYEFTKGWNLDLHAGSGDTTTFGAKSVMDYSAGVSTSAGGFDISAAYVYGEGDVGNEGKGVISISRSM